MDETDRGTPFLGMAFLVIQGGGEEAVLVRTFDGRKGRIALRFTKGIQF